MRDKKESIMLKAKKLAALTCSTLLADSALGSFVFTDVRPKTFKQGGSVDIHVGALLSAKSQIAEEFYALNYCPSRHMHEDAEELS